MTVFDRLGVPIVINAKGPATRLSGGIMREEVAAAMAEASQFCVDIAELQAAASARIAALTGAEAGCVATGAAACLLLATAACITGLDPAAMARLPETGGLKNQVVMVRSQRNFYDHAVRTAGVNIVEVGLPDRYAGAGVRDAEAWEIAAAISDKTAAVFYVADRNSRPPLADVVKTAHAAGVPVIVDAAAQLPPQSNLQRFIAEGADLVAFSGGKVIGGPQASGFLCGRRDLIMAAALQQLDLDILWELWEPPPSLIDKRRLKGLPPHGIGRPCKAGKEEIVGLVTALELFVDEGDAARHARWLADVQAMQAAIGTIDQASLTIENETDPGEVPLLALSLDGHAMNTTDLLLALEDGTPPIHADPSRIDERVILFNPQCLRAGEAETVGRAVRSHLLKA
jgi:L-seryl-tRNA(Ser) seleniumtransferase